MATLKQINARIARDVSPLVELVRGEGYHYFVLDAEGAYETRSVMVPYTSDQTAFQWVEDAKTFAADMGIGS